MLAIPTALQSKFDEQIQIRAVPIALHELYKKWLLYYLDFCRKYKFPPRQEKSLPPFLKKLQDKQQSKMQQEQAAEDVHHFDADHNAAQSCPKISLVSSQVKLFTFHS